VNKIKITVIAVLKYIYNTVEVSSYTKVASSSIVTKYCCFCSCSCVRLLVYSAKSTGCAVMAPGKSDATTAYKSSLWSKYGKRLPVKSKLKILALYTSLFRQAAAQVNNRNKKRKKRKKIDSQ